MSEYLILGGTGKTGRRIANHLGKAGHTARAAARNPDPGGIRFDWDDEASHGPALEGVAGVWVVPPALRLEHDREIGRLSRRAADAGARVVLLSARGVDKAPESGMFRSEQAVAESGAAWTVVRPSWFAQNFTESFFAPGVAAGRLDVPTGGGAEPFIDVEDIAAVAVEALTGEGHAGVAYDISGPAALTFGEAAEILGARVGHPVIHADLSRADWEAGAVQNGLTADYAAMLGQLFDVIRAGYDAEVSDGVERVLGRPATSFAAWAAREVTPA